ncbi:MAG: hypothetical protein B6I24_03745 [Bacteroidetes bacterium 4572_128]|nr:MAG: hypothetical protein B6I24_03745 [Bacteroidetes bacterium 4572_128]
MLKFNLIENFSDNNLIIIADKNSDLSKFNFSEKELNFIKKSIKDKKKQITINHYDKFVFVNILEKSKKKLEYKDKENARKSAFALWNTIQNYKLKEIEICDIENRSSIVLAFAEGLALSNYQFLKYFSKKNFEKKRSFLEKISFVNLKEEDISELKNLMEAVYLTRDLVNEPVNFLNTEKFSCEIKRISEEIGFSAEIFDKKKIESLKMGGIIAVNKGSIDPPSFAILEWKPENPKNEKVIVLVGKGIVYDTGGLSLKPSNSMMSMKSDVSGACSVLGTFYAVAKNKLDVHIIGLIPITDNRPSHNAYVPDDIIKMYDGTTVEVQNTDAEGRMILADALSYAKRYEPKLVIDLATLTGASAYFIGKEAIVSMTNEDAEEHLKNLQKSGENVYERLVNLPMWEEYAEQIKSNIADIRNVGDYAGSITAGKFLEHFTDYPWIHLDIAGTAFLDRKDNYRGKGGTGSGVRLLYDFLKNY